MKRIPIFLLVLLYSCEFCSSDNTTRTSYRRAWSLLENFTVNTIRDLAIRYENELEFVFQSPEISLECRKSLRQFVDGLKSVEINAVRRLDSWGRIPSGLLDGSWINLGAFSQCMESTSNRYCLLFANMPLMAPHQIEGFMYGYDAKNFNFSSSLFKHVQPYIHHLRFLNITSGVCVPRECNRRELQNIAQNISSNYGTGLRIDVDMCQSRDERNPFSPAEIVALCFISALLLASLVGMCVSKESFWYNWNFRENFRKIMKRKEKEAVVPCLDGLKALNMFYMITVHSFFALIYQNFISQFRAQKQLSNPVALGTLFGPFTMEAFFLFTGLETTLMYLQNHEKLKAYLFLFLRWARFVPMIGFMICLHITLFSNHVRDIIGGPFWNYYHATGSIAKTCPKTWWAHVLLIQHHLLGKDDVNLCLTPDWYLEADYVFAVLFVVIILPFIRRGKRHFAVLSALLMVIAGMLFIGAIMHAYNVQHSFLPMAFQQEKFVKYVVYIHIRPWGHLSAYFVGVLLGFAMSSSKIKVEETTKWILWLIWLCCLLIILFYELVTNLNLLQVSYHLSLLYGSWSKVLFSYLVAWFIYACHNQFIRPSIGKFLSSHAFTVLARINLSAMFMNLLVYRIRNATFHTSLNLNLIDYTVSVVLPMLGLIYLISLLNCILVEVPSVNIIKSIVMGSRKEHKDRDSEYKNQTHNEFPLLDKGPSTIK